MESKPQVLILTGYGLNCEAESRVAWERAGGAVTLLHLADALNEPSCLRRFKAIMFIGGFSFGDHMGSGHVLALRLRHRLREELDRHIQAGRLILGVCNGFQVLVRLGLLPAAGSRYFVPQAALLQNERGVFRNAWVTLRFEPDSPCIFTTGLTKMELPIRHGEGKFFVPDVAIRKQLEAERCVACRYADPATGQAARKYPHNPNGSLDAVAGVCDPSGRLFGLMPHPEAYLFSENHPHWSRRAPDELPPLGLVLFQNAVAWLRQS